MTAISGTAQLEYPRDKAAIAAVYLFAILDSAAPLGYLAFGDPVSLQIAGLTAKLATFVLVPSLLRLDRAAVAILSVLLFMALTGSIMDGLRDSFSPFAVLRYVAFSASLLATMIVLRPGTVRAYCGIFVIIPLGVALIHVVLCLNGTIYSSFGRYFYVGNTHPNLGGEIAAMSTVAAAIAFGTGPAVAVLMVFLASCLLMQSRAAILAILLVLAVLLFRATARVVGPYAILLIMLVSGIAVAGLYAAGMDPLNFLSDTIFLADDPNRGAGSGLVGRDMRWSIGLGLFFDSPILGAGIGVFDSGRLLSPHNAILFGLAQHGVVYVVFLATFLPAALRMWQFDRAAAILLLPVSVVLTLLNDRFVNLNIYPFLMYALVFSYRFRRVS